MFRPSTRVRALPASRRTAGQSLRDTKDRLLDNVLIPCVFGPAILWMIFLTQLVYSVSKRSPQPTLWLTLALIATIISALKFRSLRSLFVRLNRGECAERCVSDVLEDLREFGFRPVHDLQFDGFNIDHVVVGPSGIYAIETKFRSGRGEIEFGNGSGLLINGA